MTLRLHSTMISDGANGPGRRFVVWFQGCSFACPGCINATTHSTTGEVGYFLSYDVLLKQILAEHSREPLEGVSLTGGEPLQNDLTELWPLIVALPKELTVIMFTGYTLREILSPGWQVNQDTAALRRQVMASCDVVISGRYRQDLRGEGDPLCSSTNQQLLFMSDRYTKADLAARCVAREIVVQIDEGKVIRTGTK